MSIQCDRDLMLMLREGLIKEPDFSMVNPASIDIRLGQNAIRECSHGRFERVLIPKLGLTLEPGDFILVDTMEEFCVPNGYGVNLLLKSSTARRGFNHLLAFWLDPGYRGRPTMEIKNELSFNTLRLVPGERFAQALVHELSGLSINPYCGKYQGAEGVEGAKK